MVGQGHSPKYLLPKSNGKGSPKTQKADFKQNCHSMQRFGVDMEREKGSRTVKKEAIDR